MKNRIMEALLTFSIIFLSGCSTLKQSKDEIIFRDPDNGTNLVKIDEYSKYDNKNELDKLWLYASLSADVYLPVNDPNRLINNDGNWQLYCANKVDQSITKECNVKEGLELGLEYEVWVNEIEGETVISFRGTDFEEKEDWRSNLRWFVPIKEKDQYDVVGSITPKIVQEINNKYNNMAFITTGHSLGGGLAQRAAYSSEDVQLVYAFDPSMVTGFFDVFSIFDFLKHDKLKEINIYRVFEHGEVLAYPRWFMKILFPLSNQNPRIAELRFDYSKGGLIAQHSMYNFAQKLRKDFMASAKSINHTSY